MIRKCISTVVILTLAMLTIQCVQKPQLDTTNINKSRDLAAASKEKLSFQTCSSQRRNYLEDIIVRTVPREYLETHESDWDRQIPMKCIQFAQQRFHGSFAYCANENERPKTNAPRPCLTENYTTLVYNAYHDVKNCFNLNPKRSFIQIMIESGFHINAINRTGFDAGISQFTKNGILRVMEGNLLNRTSQILLESSNPSCMRIASIIGKLQADAFEVNRRCSMISLPQNPYRAMVLHYLHTMRDQLYFKQELLPRYVELEDAITDDVVEQLVYFAYNRGISGTLGLLSGYVKSRQAVNHKITSEDLNLWQNLADARKIMRAEPEKRRELARSKIKNLTFAEYAIIQDKSYLANMSEARDLVRARFGDQCF